MLDSFPLPVFKTGKVRTLYECGAHLLMVASDRISAFDRVWTPEIPQKGKYLTEISTVWFGHLRDVLATHWISNSLAKLPPETRPFWPQLRGRSMLVWKTDLIPVECVVRGYLAGSAWKTYQETGEVWGHILPAGLQAGDKLPRPIFTPTTKSTQKDLPLSFAELSELLGPKLAFTLQEVSLALYAKAQRVAQSKRLILADTKFEFGFRGHELLLIDEACTPDSSRFWLKTDWKPGVQPPGLDKQLVRDYLAQHPDSDTLPADLVQKTRRTYKQIRDLLKK